MFYKHLLFQFELEEMYKEQNMELLLNTLDKLVQDAEASSEMDHKAW